MNDVVLVALISAGVALITSLLTQILSALTANKAADRAEKREALLWERNEAIRQEDMRRNDSQAALAWERSEALRIQEHHEARVQELWGHVLKARGQMQEVLEKLMEPEGRYQSAAEKAASLQPSNAAAHAYSVALLGLESIRPTARAFYMATLDLQISIIALAEKPELQKIMATYSQAFSALERQISALNSSESVAICIDEGTH